MKKYEKIIHEDRTYYIKKDNLSSELYNSYLQSRYRETLILWSEIVIDNNTNTLVKCRFDLNEVFDKVFDTQPDTGSS